MAPATSTATFVIASFSARPTLGGLLVRNSPCVRASPARRRRVAVSMSALDAIPEPMKLNAVAESLARSRDVTAALAVAAELRNTGATLQSRTRAAIVDAIAASPGAVGAELLGQLFATEPPAGFGTANASPTGAVMGGRLDGASSSANVAKLPDAGRRVDMGLAAAFLAVVGTSVGAEVIEPIVLHHAATEATTVLMLTTGGIAFDRFAAAGHWWNRVSAGLDRLLSDDPAREAQVESAYFLTAYLLGLPCAPFRPDVGQLLRLHGMHNGRPSRNRASRREYVEATSSSSIDLSAPNAPPRLFREDANCGAVEEYRPPLDEDTLDRYLVWLLSGVAAESMVDGFLVESDAARARELLRAVAKPDETRILAAYARACELLTRHQVAHAKLAESMLGGVSAGNCVTLLETSFVQQPNNRRRRL
jgi:hypothetical protein